MKNRTFTNQKWWLQSFAALFAFLLSFTLQAQYPSGSPVAVNGKLSVSGGQLVNECGNPVQLRGMSTHGVQWFENCYNESSLDALVNDWGVDIFRIAMYVEDGGYVNNPSYWKNWIDNMVNECAERGIYCMIDWHVLHPGDPWANIDAARDFWSYMSAKHAGKEHVLYEIANEPNGVEWPRVKSYAEDIIPRIRANDPSTVVIVGTPTWSQDVDIASADPLNFDNLMYTLHFYAGTHTDYLRQKGNTALANGAALFVTEFGTSQASGDGGPYLEETQRWMDWMAQNKISWINWSFADKAEVSAALSPGACGGNWNNTSQSGTFIKDHILNPADNFACGDVGTTTYTISAAAGTGGSISPNGSVSVNEGANQTFTISASSGYEIEDVEVNGSSVGAVGSYTFSNVQANQQISASFRQATGTSSQQAFGGTPHAFPGALEAVNFDTGGEGVAYHDTSVGNEGNGPRSGENVDTEYGTTAGNVGWIEAGEWLEYTVNVAQAGTYAVGVQVASSPGGGAYHIEFNGTDVTGTQTVGATGGWASFTTQTIEEVSLSAGEQVMRVYMEAGSFNIARMNFTLSDGNNNEEENNAPVAQVSATPLSGTAPLEVSFNASASSDPDGDALSYSWNFGDGTTGTGATPIHTYTAANTYTATVTVSDGKGGTDQASVNISATSANDGGDDGNTGDCSFGAPRASALPSVNKSYNYVHVLGSGGPDLSNVSGFTINWDLPNRGLWQFSMNTSNGNPSWYVDLLSKVSHTFTQAQPSIMITGSGFAGLDGEYNVNLLEGAFVMASVSGDYTIYFSESATRPDCSSSATMARNSRDAEFKGVQDMKIFPNPFSDELTIRIPNPEEVESILILNAQGQVVQNIEKKAVKANTHIRLQPNLGKGLYLIQVTDTQGKTYLKAIKK